MSDLRWLRKLTPSLLAAGVTSVLTLLAGILLARMLDPADLGRYTLLVSVAGTIALVGTLGQPMLTRRLYALKSLGSYDWPRDLANSIIFAAPVLVLLLLGLSLFYRFTPLQTVVLVALTACSVLLLFFDQTLIAMQQYARGNAIMRLPNALLLLPVALLAFIDRDATLLEVIIWRLLTALIAVLLGIRWLARRQYRGSAQIEAAARGQGYSFLLLAVTTLLIGEGGNVLAGFVVPAEELGAFAALTLFARPWQITTLAVQQISSVEAAKHARPWKPRQWIVLQIVATAGALLCAMIFPALIHWLYDGRYDQYSALGWPIMATGAILLIEAPPRASMVARGLPALVRSFSWTQAALAIVAAIVVLLVGARLGIAAVVWVFCGYAGARCLISLGFATLQLPRQNVAVGNAESAAPAPSTPAKQRT